MSDELLPMDLPIKKARKSRRRAVPRGGPSPAIERGRLICVTVSASAGALALPILHALAEAAGYCQ